MYVEDVNLERFLADRLRYGWLKTLSPGFAGAERRQEQRYSLDERAWMHTVYPVASRRRLVRIVDVSKSGLRIETVLPELQGASVRVHFNDVFVIGEVRFCVEAGEHYQIGIRIDSALYAMPDGMPAEQAEPHLLRRPA
jgi:hypothetical protein